VLGGRGGCFLCYLGCFSSLLVRGGPPRKLADRHRVHAMVCACFITECRRENVSIFIFLPSVGCRDSEF
jgi:hypothetical protein